MLNSTGPFVEFSKTVMVALAVSLFMVMTMSLFRICRVEFSICSDTCKVTVIVSPAIANSGSVLLLVTLRVCTPGMLLSIVTFDEFNCVWSTVKLFPARSKAVMSNDTSLATVNNILNITITANETIKAANITILGSTHVMNVNGTVANASVNVDQNSAEGDVSFDITAFDLAGNSFTVDQTQLNSSNVTIDSSIPGVQTLSVTSNNTDPEFAMAGDTITVTLQVSEQIENSTLQILNNDIVMTINNDTANATITVLENSTNGPVEFNITAYDKTGNVFNVTSENITENNVVV